jgi:hypothetical protein
LFLYLWLRNINKHTQKTVKPKKAYAFCVKVNIIDRLFCVQAV